MRPGSVVDAVVDGSAYSCRIAALLFLVELDLPVGGEALGATLTLDRASEVAPTAVHFPGAPRNPSGIGPERGLTPPTSVDPLALPWWTGWQDDDDDFFWGSVYGHTNDGRATKVHAARLVCEVSTTDLDDPTAASDLVQAAAEAVEAWARIARDWHEVLTGSHLSYPEAYRSGRRVFDYPVYKGDGPAARAALYQWPRQLWSEFRRVASIDQVRFAFSEATHGREPPPEQLLLRNARIAILLHDTRRAVLEAATAAEMTLADHVNRTVTDGFGAVAAEEISGNRSGARLVALAKATGAPLPKDLVGRLFTPRNKAIHRNERVSAAEAKEAVTAAAQLIGALRPLSKLGAPSTHNGEPGLPSLG
jgi:hypothetical protein